MADRPFQGDLVSALEQAVKEVPGNNYELRSQSKCALTN